MCNNISAGQLVVGWSKMALAEISGTTWFWSLCLSPSNRLVWAGSHGNGKRTSRCDCISSLCWHVCANISLAEVTYMGQLRIRVGTFHKVMFQRKQGEVMNFCLTQKLYTEIMQCVKFSIRIDKVDNGCNSIC